MRTALSLILISLLGFFSFYYQTDAFSVVTTESARRINIQNNPILINDAALITADNTTLQFIDEIKRDGRIAIVNFIYTRCTDICISMGSELQQLQAKITEKGLKDKIRLISISFDNRDNAKWLDNYRQRMRLDSDIWQVFLAKNDNQRQQLLDQFGIIVVPAPLGQFEHNAAYHIVTPDAHLNKIIDIGTPKAALSWALAYASNNYHSAGTL